MPPDPEGPLRRIGPYRIERRLGAGGMGVVYLGRDDASGTVAAVKVIKPEFAADQRFRARLRREVAAARRVPRFCTAPVVGADLEAEPPYIATEYIDGPTLDVAVLERGTLRGADLEGLATGVAVALRAIHGQGVIHRDLKPSNIVLSSVGPRVIDFGIARLEDAETELTQVGGVIGTLAYMAPEQVRGAPVTAAADIFAWASLVTYAATGRPPFGTGHDVRRRILTEEPDVQGLEDPLRGVVQAAFAKDPLRRPSASDLVDRLSRSTPTMLTWVLETAAAWLVPPATKRGWPSADPDPDEPDLDEPDPDGPALDEPVAASSRRVPPRQRAQARRRESATRPSWVTGRAKGWSAVLAMLVVFVVVPGTIWLSRGDRTPGGFGSQIGDSLTDHSGDVEAVAVGTLNGRTIAVSGSDDKTVRVWDLATGEQLGEPLKGHRDAVYTVAIGELNGRTIAVSGSSGVGGSGILGLGENDNGLRVWDLATRKQIGRRLTHADRAGGGPDSVAMGRLNGRTIAVSGSDETVRVWDLATSKQIGKPLVGGSPVAVGTVKGRTVAVSDCLVYSPPPPGKCDDGTAVVWDLAARRRLGEPLSGNDYELYAHAVAIGRVNGRPIAVSGTSTDDHALRVWDLTTGKQIGKPLIGHTHNVFGVAVGTLNGRTIAVSGSVDSTVRVWDLATARQLGRPFTGHDGIVESVALGELNGRPVVVSGGADDTVRVWDLGPPYPSPFP